MEGEPEENRKSQFCVRNFYIFDISWSVRISRTTLSNQYCLLYKQQQPSDASAYMHDIVLGRVSY